MNISVQELKNLHNIKIIDIRPSSAYNMGHIMNAVNISYNSLVISPNKFLNKNDTYYIYCTHGQTSKGLCQFLRGQGYKVVNIIGGYEAWSKNG